MTHSPFRFSKTPVVHRMSPALGADTRELLREQLQIDDTQWQALAAASVVSATPRS